MVRRERASTRSPSCSPAESFDRTAAAVLQNRETRMHKSRLAGFIIDCNTPDLDAAAAFWTQALGYPLKKLDGDQGIYRELETGATGLHIEVQQVEHPSRVHLDIETDDIEAEATR